MSRNSPPVSVVLASGSATRRRLLDEVLEDFEVEEARSEEKPDPEGGSPEAVAVRRAEVKAADVGERRPDSLVIAADTVVECCDSILGKPRDEDEAVDMLRLLTSHPQRVITGLCLLTPAGLRLDRLEAATVEMRDFSEREMRDYVRKHSVCDRAGAYSLRPDDPNVTRLEGSTSAVKGLPLERLREALETIYPGWDG